MDPVTAWRRFDGVIVEAAAVIFAAAASFAGGIYLGDPIGYVLGVEVVPIGWTGIGVC
jgi:hypothetical protein